MLGQEVLQIGPQAIIHPMQLYARFSAWWNIARGGDCIGEYLVQFLGLRGVNLPVADRTNVDNFQMSIRRLKREVCVLRENFACRNETKPEC